MKVKFSQLSAFKLKELIVYLRNVWSDKVADDFLDKLDRAVDQISKFPNASVPYLRDSTIRVFIVTKQTSIYYKAEGEIIYVLTITDNRQDPSKIFKEVKRQFE
ncbi:MAG: type II toxin-antitoxin system RelE/ParE family toxin [Bacteroidetes bacterium]|nr:type II toxin-antitoxin system RelE/ParE family toxin [Bacteroidota bacterium]